MAIGISRYHIIVIISIAVVMLVGVRLYFDRDAYMKLYKEEMNARMSAWPVNPINNRAISDTIQEASKDDVYLTIAQLVQQRNNISRAMNLKQRKIGQMECEKQKQGAQVASTGGWCAKASKEHNGQHKTDTKLVPVLAQFFKGKKVASFGDGPGRYKQLLLETGLLEGYDAYDGAPFCEETSEGRVKYLDLTLPQYGLPLYDWVMSLEVAEHIPQQYESIYLDNIVRHAKEGVVLSWAVPGQEGYSHVNNRPFKYVKEVFEKMGFEHDEENSKKLQKNSKLEWLQKNTNVYRRKDMSKMEHIKTFLT